MNVNDDDPRSEQTSAETTAALPPDTFAEPDEHDSLTAELGEPDRLPAGAAVLIVTRGRNAGAGFLLDRESTSAGRHPDSDILLDDITVSRRHAEFRRESGALR